MGSICSNCSKGVVFDPLMPGIDTEFFDPIPINGSKISFIRNPKTSNFDYHVVEQVSSNEFYVKKRKSSKKYFMKTYPLLHMNEKQNSQISRELRILKLLRDEKNFIHVHKTVKHGEQLCVLYSDLPSCLHDFVLEERNKCHNDEVIDIIDTNDQRRSQYLERVKFIFFDLLCIVEKIHSLGIYHFNLHPKNIRFGHSGELILTGFEKSRQKRYLRIKNVFSNFQRKKTKRRSNNNSKKEKLSKKKRSKQRRRESPYLKEEEEEEEEEEKEYLYNSEDESCFYPERIRRVEQHLIESRRRRNRKRIKKERRQRRNNKTSTKYDNDICDGEYVDRYSLACILYFMVTNGSILLSNTTKKNKNNEDENEEEEEGETEEEDDDDSENVSPKRRSSSYFSEEEEEETERLSTKKFIRRIRRKVRMVNKGEEEEDEVYNDGVCNVIQKLINNDQKNVDLKKILDDSAWLKM